MRWSSITWPKLGIALSAAATLGAAVVVSGIVPIAASSGHFAVTEWFLKFAMHRSIATHSMGIDVPDLDEDRLVLLGAGHYESGCRFCHGAPGVPPSSVAASSTPPPPALTDITETYDAAEFFTIVRHGVKFTGMPAWPSAVRDDEVWAVVAFLQDFPRLDRPAYEGLVFGSTRGQHLEGAPRALAQCSRCHGLRGQGRGQAFPQLAGQSAAYLEASLLAYAAGRRPSGIMQQLADLSVRDRHELVEWFAAQPIPQPRGQVAQDDARYLAGERIAREGVAKEGVPSCQDCHGPDSAMRSAYPILSGQPYSFLKTQLQLFAAGHRGGSPFSKLMEKTNAHALDSRAMDAVSIYYSSLSRASPN